MTFSSKIEVFSGPPKFCRRTFVNLSRNSLRFRFALGKGATFFFRMSAGILNALALLTAPREESILDKARRAVSKGVVKVNFYCHEVQQTLGYDTRIDTRQASPEKARVEQPTWKSGYRVFTRESRCLRQRMLLAPVPHL